MASQKRKRNHDFVTIRNENPKLFSTSFLRYSRVRSPDLGQSCQRYHALRARDTLLQNQRGLYSSTFSSAMSLIILTAAVVSVHPRPDVLRTLGTFQGVQILPCKWATAIRGDPALS